MNNSSNKDQHYALDSSGNIRHIKDANPSNDEFFCLFCHRQMIAKQGKIRQWHFAHKALSPNCSYESYLHSLAKLLILQKLRSEQPFGVEIKVPFTCKNKETCIWYEDSFDESCNWTGYKNYDLKKFYNTFEVEAFYDNFRADILLSNSIKKYTPVFIEIYVSHPCEHQKIDLGNKIIELKINSEDDIKPIINSPIITEDGNLIRLYNFKPKGDFTGPPQHPKQLVKFSVFESYKMYCGNTDCQTFSCHRNKAIFELTSDFHPDFLPEYSLYDYGIVELYDLDPNLKVCNLCRYYRPRDILFDDLFDIRINKRPIFCCLYKKLGTDKYRDPSDARTCTAFRKIDGKTMAEIRQEYKMLKTIIWKKPND
mgnify:FL=1